VLVLTRQVNDRIHIGDDVYVMVIETKGNKVRLGIEAPKGVPVHRHEVYDAIQQEKNHADAR
jgi:carbon storage regulator